jgi:hypothetical protein
VEFTEKAVKEIKKLQDELESLQLEEKTLSARLSGGPYERILFDALRRERNRLYTKLENKQNRIDTIQRRGISTSEFNTLCKYGKNCPTAVKIESDTSLGMRGSKFVFYYPAYGKYYELSYTRYNGFMRNVKGCSGLADTTSWGNPIELSEDEAKEAIKVNKHFGFSEKKVVERTQEEVETLMARFKAVAV